MLVLPGLISEYVMVQVGGLSSSQIIRNDESPGLPKLLMFLITGSRLFNLLTCSGLGRLHPPPVSGRHMPFRSPDRLGNA